MRVTKAEWIRRVSHGCRESWAAAGVSVATEVFYPETDGMPMPDAPYQSIHYHNLIGMLRVFTRLRGNVVVGGDVFIYYVEGDPRMVVAPGLFRDNRGERGVVPEG